MKKILPFIFLFFCFINLNAQENKVDSLTVLINNSDAPIEKAKLLIKRCKALFLIYFANATHFQ